MHVSTTDERTLVRALGVFTKHVLHATGKDFYAAVGELDLSLTQIRALHFLTGEVEEASLNRLAEAIGLSLPAASRSVDGLVQRGLVSRTENASDRRAKTLTATPDAHALMDDLDEMRLVGLADFVSSLTEDDRRRLADAIGPIVDRLPTKDPSHHA